MGATGQRRIGAENTLIHIQSPEALPTSQCHPSLLPNIHPMAGHATGKQILSSSSSFSFLVTTFFLADKTKNGLGDVLQSVGAARPC